MADDPITWFRQVTSSQAFGRPQVNAASPNCCGKPEGCTMSHEDCLYLDSPRAHPYKREQARLRRAREAST